MYHAYGSDLNKKVRNVLQYSLEGEFIAEYKSVAQASKVTNEPEHRIRDISKGKKNSKAQFMWKFKNNKETAEFSQKYATR